MFTGRLHKANEYNIFFAKRGSSDRTKALEEVVEAARRNSKVKGKVDSVAIMNVNSTTPREHYALQAADYFLWALQRFYERREDRYLNYIKPSISTILDIDDKRKSQAGVYYSREYPIALDLVPQLAEY
jgi:hypothetical protein